LRSEAERTAAQYDKWLEASMAALDVTVRLIFYRNDLQ
jgi:hypothetical protein